MPETALQEAARAKVNLYLHVTGKRADGYHLLDSLAVFPGAADLLTASPSDRLSLTVQGPFAAGLAAEPGNLVLRAAAALQSAAGMMEGAALTLDKRLPIASGIGGGSADAAAALRLLSRLWRLSVPPAELAAIAMTLGADVPVCLASQPARMGGIGEVLGVAPGLPDCGMVLLNPGLAVSTPEVFRARRAGFTGPAALPPHWPDAGAMAEDLVRTANDLEAPALLCCPAIAEVLTWLRAEPGCLLARMSGSGATCFALFATASEADRVARSAPPTWWRWGGGLR